MSQSQMPRTIVLADDHRLVREGLRRLLEEHEGYKVVGEASTGDEAVALAAAEKPDVVVMDLTMPGITGIEATRRIRTGRNGARVLVLSMHGNRSYVEEVFKAGASGYVLKDAAACDLIAAIDAVCAGETFLSPSITQQVVDALSNPGELGDRSISTLTDREREVLTLIAEGLSSKEIGERLGVSLKTVESHRANLMDKLDIHKVSALVRFAIRAGLVAA